MSTLETIKHNMAQLANANIDWSISGGMIWLVGLTVVALVMFTTAVVRN